MKLMKRSILTLTRLTFLLAIFSVIVFGLNKTQDNKSGKIKIYVSSYEDENTDKVDIQPYRIFVKGNNLFREMLYKNNQTFELNVPQGIYNIILKENVGEYLPYRRANFYVTQGKITELRMSDSEGIRQVCNKTFGLVMLPTHTSISKDEAPLTYNEIPDYKPNNVIVRYCYKKIYKTYTSYEFALLTYDNINIYADKLTISKKDFKLKATGKPDSPVWIEVGNCRTKTKNLESNKRILVSLKDFCASSYKIKSN